MLIHVCTVDSCFYGAAAEFRSNIRDGRGHKAQNILSRPLPKGFADPRFKVFFSPAPFPRVRIKSKRFFKFLSMSEYHLLKRGILLLSKYFAVSFKTLSPFFMGNDNVLNINSPSDIQR